MTKIINGKEIAQDLRNKLRQEISDLKNETHYSETLIFKFN